MDALEVVINRLQTNVVFLPYGITYNDNATGTRNCGLGSTGA